MQGLVNACFGVLFGTGLYFIGLPNAALWGVLGGTLRIIPYVGTLAAAAFPLALSLAVFNTWLPPILVFVLYAVLELTIANVVEPWLYGTHTGISPLAILVTAIFWATLWGPAGLILSTPLSVCMVVLGRSFRSYRSFRSCSEINRSSRPRLSSTSGCWPWIKPSRGKLQKQF